LRDEAEYFARLRRGRIRLGAVSRGSVHDWQSRGASDETVRDPSKPIVSNIFSNIEIVPRLSKETVVGRHLRM
jgi:hypothetical protein